MEYSRRDGVVSVKLARDDLERPVDVYSAFEELILDRGERRITVDLSEVTMLTSLMIGTLVSVHLLAYENVVVISFQGMHEKIAALFHLIGVDSLIRAHYPAPGPGPQRGAGNA